MTDDERKAEIDRLKSMLAASERIGGIGYARRIEAIKAKLTELEAE